MLLDLSVAKIEWFHDVAVNSLQLNCHGEIF